jgi:hypothetical protein
MRKVEPLNMLFEFPYNIIFFAKKYECHLPILLAYLDTKQQIFLTVPLSLIKGMKAFCKFFTKYDNVQAYLDNT